MDQTSDLLEWYDVSARVMPWRVGPQDRQAGQRPDPYRVWLSEVMLQQTTVAAVKEYFLRFTTRWPTVADLAAAADEDVMAEWAGLGYYARARNLLKCARVVAGDLGGIFPDTREALLKLPGIGPYTAAAISSIAFDRAETVVDGNVERVMARVYDVHTPLPRAKPELTALAEALTPPQRPGDYAQAVMDLGATICTPAIRPAGFAHGARLVWPVSAALPPNCPRKSRRNPNPPGWALPISRSARMGPICWNAARTKACWAGCWAGPVRIGARRPSLRLLSRPIGSKSRPRRATPLPISTCA